MNTQIVAQISAAQLYADGFDQYLDCVVSSDFLTKEEFECMTPDERKGHEDAISAADYAETSAYLHNVNGFGDRTGGWA